jgi:peroxiredoxin
MASSSDEPRGKRWLKRALSYAAQILVAVVVIWGVSEWQARGLLPRETSAPAFSLRSLEGEELTVESLRGRKVVLYFFAPWCSVCNLASKNIVALREARGEDDVAIVAVGLGWNRRSEVEEFASEHHLNVPVLLGNDEVLRDYNIGAFPTIYVLDERGVVQDRLVGYTTEIGLRLRTL